MTNNAQENINQLTNKAKIRYLDISNRDLTKIHTPFIDKPFVFGRWLPCK